MTTTSSLPTKRRVFSPTGAVYSSSEHHFYIDPSEWNQKNLLPLVEAETFFVLCAPSQTGKTSRAKAFTDTLRKQFNMETAWIDASAIVGQVKGEQGFWPLIVKVLRMQGIQVDDNKTSLLEFLVNGPTRSEKENSFFLVIDEIHSISLLPEPERLSFLTSLRCVKQTGPRWLKSLMVITNHTGGYLVNSYGSPFNNVVFASYWTKQEVYQLIEQYEQQESITVSTSVKDNIFSQTNGAHGTTVMLCKYLSNLIEEQGKSPDLGEWLNKATLMNQSFRRFLHGFPNIYKISYALKDKAVWQPLLRWMMVPGYEPENDVTERLQKENIIRYRNTSTVEIASPLVRMLILLALRSQLGALPVPVPTSVTGKLDLIKLVIEVVRRMNLFRLVQSNRLLARADPGLNESLYSNDFHITLSHVFAHLFPVVQPMHPTGEMNQDHLLRLFHNNIEETLAVEHVVNVDRTPLEKHVQQQAAKFNQSLKPTLGTLLIHWTNVHYITSGKYPFPNAEGITVLHIWHDEYFENWEAVTSNNNYHIEAELCDIEEATHSMRELTLPSAPSVKQLLFALGTTDNSGNLIQIGDAFGFPPSVTKLEEMLRRVFAISPASQFHLYTTQGVKVYPSISHLVVNEIYLVVEENSTMDNVEQ